jgi:hypothetical protein
VKTFKLTGFPVIFDLEHPNRVVRAMRVPGTVQLEEESLYSIGDETSNFSCSAVRGHDAHFPRTIKAVKKLKAMKALRKD